MSIWAEVKKAINGTVGTQNFKPLDELYRDSRYVYACDHGLLAYSGSIYYKNTNFYVKINIPGTYRASAIFSRNSSDFWYANITVYKKVNGEYQEIGKAERRDLVNNAPETISVDFSVQSGDIIRINPVIYTQSYGQGGTINNLRLCGMIGTGGAPAEVYTE